MADVYYFGDLASAPSLGMIENRVLELIATQMTDISYHNEEAWLRIWFASELSDDEESTLNGIVEDSLGVTRFRRDVGSVFFELSHAGDTRWQKHTRRINFNIPFFDAPTVTVSDAVFDGSADMEIINVTRGYFDFRVTATKSRHKSKGFNSIEFDWRAESWQA